MSTVLSKERADAIVSDVCNLLDGESYDDAVAEMEALGASHETLRIERDAARRLAVHQHLRFWPDCEVSPDPVRSRRHTAVGLFGLTHDEADRLFPKEG